MEKYDEYLEFFCSKESRQSYELIDGYGNVMISAPHSVEQTREGKIKFGEYDTGVMAKCLHDELNCPVIYKTCNCNDDANYDKFSDYRDTLRSYIKKNHIEFLLDLHELSHKREVNIDLGTGNGANIHPNPVILDVVKIEFEKSCITNILVDDPFDAVYPYTVSAFIARECSISCLQVEINSRLLCKQFDDYCFDNVYYVLRDSVKKLRGYRL